MQKSDKNKAILEKANAAVAAGNNEAFLLHCTEDTEWTFVGERTLMGKQAVREYMAATYLEPPKFTTNNVIAEGDFLTVLGDITLKDKHGEETSHAYCDVWQFRDGKIAGLRAFVIKNKIQEAK